ncbi:MAG TPA: RsmB/NOP family class I SAM-dependent RNA methyltransferase [Stellaceae bacterium]|nr:RsmB/NOP family class I SAM-dependent RNA methyltransferase [Stellaceae bacterium]
MTPGARIAAAIDILETMAAGSRPADDVAAGYFRKHRYIGAKDRAQVARHVYAVLRHRAALDWWVERAGRSNIAASPRSRMMAALLVAEGEPAGDIAGSFDGGRFRPAALSPVEDRLVKTLAGRSLRHPAMPRAVANDLPDWLEPHLEAVYGDRLEAEMAGLNAPAPVDLRVNLLKTDREGARRALAADQVHAEPTEWSPVGLRLRERVPLSGLAAFKEGLVEVQDEGSQLAALLLGAGPGMRVVDFCAGAGGKTLALAASMQNRGKLVACDTAAWRLDRSGQRLRRAGVSNVERRALASERDPWVKRHAKGFDRVLVDAPCLGIGSWRRNPDAKWRATPNDLAELQIRQHDILQSAARLVKPGGRLAYVTCSLLVEENEAQAERFLDETPDFIPVPAAHAWEDALGAPCPAGLTSLGSDYLRLTPAQHGTDGFFVAIFQRKPLQPQPASFEAPDGAPQDEEDK